MNASARESYTIRPGDPRSSGVRALIAELDAFNSALYPAESNHFDPPDALAGADCIFLVVEQHGEFRFMLFAQAMTVRLNIEHRLHRVAEARAVSFDLGLFKRRAIDVFEGRYEMTPLGGNRGALGTQLRYTAVIGLRLPPPPAVGSIAVRQNLAAQLQAVANEVARRGSRPASVSIGR